MLRICIIFVVDIFGVIDKHLMKYFHLELFIKLLCDQERLEDTLNNLTALNPKNCIIVLMKIGRWSKQFAIFF